ncbi:unnamed protein product [Protopolystoma xenopodis]|uniref:Uncharacterized protein n=1 Tax=Protopolystoma xenopodis TaxID=117903 RepID=A0A3S5BYN7_9PLAT|nr:unnamed protein product [Protopolystoma xenopodis]
MQNFVELKPPTSKASNEGFLSVFCYFYFHIDFWDLRAHLSSVIEPLRAEARRRWENKQIVILHRDNERRKAKRLAAQQKYVATVAVKEMVEAAIARDACSKPSESVLQVDQIGVLRKSRKPAVPPAETKRSSRPEREGKKSLEPNPGPTLNHTDLPSGTEEFQSNGLLSMPTEPEYSGFVPPENQSGWQLNPCSPCNTDHLTQERSDGAEGKTDGIISFRENAFKDAGIEEAEIKTASVVKEQTNNSAFDETNQLLKARGDGDPGSSSCEIKLKSESPQSSIRPSSETLREDALLISGMIEDLNLQPKCRYSLDLEIRSKPLDSTEVSSEPLNSADNQIKEVAESSVSMLSELALSACDQSEIPHFEIQATDTSTSG